MENLLFNENDVNRIIDIVCKQTGIKKEDVMSFKRNQEIAVARHIIIYFSYLSEAGTLKKIGKHFSNRDHSTIINSIRKSEAYYQTNKTFKRNVDKLCEMINPELKAVLE